MPIKGGEMTSRERVFAEAYAATGDRKEAQRRAGYKGHTGVVMAMQRPEVQAEIRAHQLKRLNNELLPLALDVVQAVLSDVNESARNRECARDQGTARDDGRRDTGQA
jgi:phage terminase small subunit